MDENAPPSGGISRKNLLKATAAAVPLSGLVAGTALARERVPGRVNGQPNRAMLEATPHCGDGDEPTISQTEGPYFSPGSPERTDLREPGMPGTPLTVSGYVFGLTCVPLSDVLLDFWQANDNGEYDNIGYTLRGHQYTKSDGSFHLETIVPGLYTGRTRHIHVKAQAPNEPILTTQLYFPGEPRNRTDRIFDPRLLMNVQAGNSGKAATFDFVLRTKQDPPDDPPDNPPDEPGGSWQAGTSYAVGDTVTYDGVTYKCRVAHVAQPGWEPPKTPALWSAV